MSEIEENEPFGGRAGSLALAAVREYRPPSPVVSFNRQELNEILQVYGRKVAHGEWRDE